ncbi:MAG: hypothetical protein ACO3E1_06210 [Flavobacteriales bacterium]
MVNTLQSKYGYCIIPKNTLLFRGYDNDSFEDCMFFATKYFVAKGFNERVQVWKTKKEMKVLFLVQNIDDASIPYSSLTDIFNQLFPEEANTNFNDLDIKQNCNRRERLVKYLFNNCDVRGWFTSVEDGQEHIELCLFDSCSIAQHLSFYGIFKNASELFYKDSLTRIKIFPTRAFYNRSAQKLMRKKKEYLKDIKAFVNEDEERYGKINRLHQRHFYYNLRVALKM